MEKVTIRLEDALKEKKNFNLDVIANIGHLIKGSLANGTELL